MPLQTVRLQCVIMAILLTGSPMNDLQPRILRWMQ